MTAEVWIGDVLQALPAGADAEMQRSVARLLGFDVSDTDAAEPVAAGQRAAHAPVEPDRPADRDEPAPAAAPETPAATTLRSTQAGDSGEPVLLSPTSYDPPPVPAWSAPALPVPDRNRMGVALPFEPLLAPRSVSALLSCALSKGVPEGDLDLPGIVERLARLRPVDALPRRPVRTLRYGVQVLVDLGSGMEPFSRDAHDVVDHVRATAGRDRTEVAYFDDCPMRGAGGGPRWTWGDYEPPAPGTRVLILSDLGLGGPRLNPRRATRAEWGRLAGLLAGARCSAVAFVPFPARRWPGWMSRLFPLVPWDRRTTAGWVASHLK